LILHDTTVLDYSKRKKLKLARVGNGHGKAMPQTQSYYFAK
jgi:hypothetical protein